MPDAGLNLTAYCHKPSVQSSLVCETRKSPHGADLPPYKGRSNELKVQSLTEIQRKNTGLAIRVAEEVENLASRATQIYDKRRRSTAESASHNVPI
jgi:hypothetical protein